MVKLTKYRFLDACRSNFRLCHLCVVLVISLLFLGYKRVYPSNEDYNSPEAALLSTNEAISYGHLLPLKEMFTKASKNVAEGTFQGSFEVTMSDLHELEWKENVLLLVIVSTAPSRMERREAIRKTWWKKCTGKVVCKFFTDGLGLSNTQQLSLTKEQQLNKDIELQPLEMGRSFGLRYLYHIMYATAKYHFTYLLRIDDDYFVCMERLLNELHHRPVKMLSWGSYHCLFRDRIYMDEAWTLFTADVIHRFLSQDPRKIVCHPHADQQIPVWVENVYSKNETLINFDDQRLHHYPPAWKQNKFKSLARVCDRYIGVHGSSPEMMLKFWRSSSDAAKEITNITDVSRTCHFPSVFDISKMRPPYNFTLRPCIENPIWTPNEGMWLGVHLGAQKIPKRDR